MMSPWISQASTPQLMKVTFLPLGIGLPTGSVTGIVVGRSDALATVASAALQPRRVDV